MNKKRLTIGQSMARARKRAKMSQCELGRRCGINNANISAYEKDLHNPNLYSLIAIADALNITLDELVGRTQI